MNMSEKETVQMLEGGNGIHYLYVDDRMILRCTNKRIVEHYYDLMTSEDWKGPRVITPLPYDSYSK